MIIYVRSLCESGKLIEIQLTAQGVVVRMLEEGGNELSNDFHVGRTSRVDEKHVTRRTPIHYVWIALDGCSQKPRQVEGEKGLIDRPVGFLALWSFGRRCGA